MQKLPVRISNILKVSKSIDMKYQYRTLVSKLSIEKYQYLNSVSKPGVKNIDTLKKVSNPTLLLSSTIRWWEMEFRKKRIILQKHSPFMYDRMGGDGV